MIDAGAKALKQWKNATAYDLAAAVYRAMSMAAPSKRGDYQRATPKMLDVLSLLSLRLPKQ
jgi:hypothetical protein